jgi:hypothetical protein
MTLNNLSEQPAAFALFDKIKKKKYINGTENLQFGSAEFEIFAVLGCYAA